MSTLAGVPPPAFDPVDTSFQTTTHDADRGDHVESPSLSNTNALARFEFEAGRSKDGTKILMVEWEEDESIKHIDGDWQISWEGKTTVLPARDHSEAQLDGVPIKRLYFLLGPGVPVPSAVKLQKGSIVWKTNPLPAIFPPELGATARQAGKKGVLHTIWAKKRLQVLQREIDTESKENAEGIGLEMAQAEKDWIEQNFGVVSRPPNLNFAAVSGVPNSLGSPGSPRSPGGGRLMDKLKGLRLGTTTQDLSNNSSDTTSRPNESNYNHPLSPETSDVAIGSFSNFVSLKGSQPLSGLAAKPSQIPTAAPRAFTAQLPPQSIAAQQQRNYDASIGGMASLNAVATAAAVPTSNTPVAFEHSTSPLIGGDDDDDDLFALPMSPRSPDMAQSPFSFTAQDTQRYLQEGNTA